jgi:hypothetical protein
MGFGLEIGFIGHFNTRLVTALNYSAIDDLHTLEITTAHAVFSVCCVFSSCSLVTASNSGYSSASALSTTPTKSSLHRLPYKFPRYHWLTSKFVSVITSRHGPRRKHHSLSYSNRFRGNVFEKVLLSNGCSYLLIKNLLPSSECCFVVCVQVFLQQGVYTLYIYIERER